MQDCCTSLCSYLLLLFQHLFLCRKFESLSYRPFRKSSSLNLHQKALLIRSYIGSTRLKLERLSHLSDLLLGHALLLGLSTDNLGSDPPCILACLCSYKSCMNSELYIYDLEFSFFCLKHCFPKSSFNKSINAPNRICWCSAA